MNKLGFNAVSEAVLPYFPFDGEIYPPLDELDETGDQYNHRHIEINIGETRHHQDVIYTLDMAGLLEGSPERDEKLAGMPLLRVIGIMPGRVLLEDLNHQQP